MKRPKITVSKKLPKSEDKKKSKNKRLDTVNTREYYRSFTNLGNTNSPVIYDKK